MAIPGDELIQAFIWQRQGFGGDLEGRPAAEVLARSGWARSVGGASPYLALKARANLSRAAVDAAVARQEIHELPSARGCTYVLPAGDFGLGLEVGAGSGDGERKVAASLGVTDKELARLEQRVLEALEHGPLDPAEIKEAVGSAARSLGPAGQKKGLSSTLPVALGRLQEAGEIRRLPASGRLDQQRYRYARWNKNPRGKRADRSEAMARLAEHYFAWHGLATAAQFAWFAGLGKQATAAALAPLGLEPLGPGDERLITRRDRDALMTTRLPRGPHYALVGSLDPMVANRRDLRPLLGPDREDRPRLLARLTQGQRGPSLGDLPSHAILDRGRLVGLWEYDPERAVIVAALFAGKPDAALSKLIAETAAWIAIELGDARAFSLDSAKSRAPRLALLRKG